MTRETAIRSDPERDEAVERWLHDEVIPAYDAMIADPDRGIPADVVSAGIRARHAEPLRDPR